MPGVSTTSPPPASVESVRQAFERCRNQRFLIFSINSDVCYYPEEQGELMAALESAGVSCMRIIVHSDKGHDSFLLEPALYHPHLTFLLEERGLLAIRYSPTVAIQETFRKHIQAKN